MIFVIKQFGGNEVGIEAYNNYDDACKAVKDFEIIKDIPYYKDGNVIDLKTNQALIIEGELRVLTLKGI